MLKKQLSNDWKNETLYDFCCISQALSIDWSQTFAFSPISLDSFQLFELIVWSLQYNRFIAVILQFSWEKSSTHILLNENRLNGKLKRPLNYSIHWMRRKKFIWRQIVLSTLGLNNSPYISRFASINTINKYYKYCNKNIKYHSIWRHLTIREIFYCIASFLYSFVQI